MPILFQLLIVFAAKYLFAIIAIAMAVGGLTLPGLDRRRFIIMAVAASLLAYLLTQVATRVYMDPRPLVLNQFTPLVPHGTDNGFPSDHSVVSFTAAFIIWPYRRFLSIGLTLLAGLVGAARVISGAHHLLDVVGAVGIAAASCTIAYFIQKFIANRWLEG